MTFQHSWIKWLVILVYSLLRPGLTSHHSYECDHVQLIHRKSVHALYKSLSSLSGVRLCGLESDEGYSHSGWCCHEHACGPF